MWLVLKAYIWIFLVHTKSTGQSINVQLILQCSSYCAKMDGKQLKDESGAGSAFDKDTSLDLFQSASGWHPNYSAVKQTGIDLIFSRNQKRISKLLCKLAWWIASRMTACWYSKWYDPKPVAARSHPAMLTDKWHKTAVHYHLYLSINKHKDTKLWSEVFCLRLYTSVDYPLP